MSIILKEIPEINVLVEDKKPKIIFTNDYILTYDKYNIYLYDLNGNILDQAQDYFFKNKEIYKINENSFISFYKHLLTKFEITNNKIK